MCFCLFVCCNRCSIGIRNPTNGYLSWSCILVWCLIHWIGSTNLAINITGCTINALVSSALLATKSNLCTTRSSNYRSSFVGGQQTAKLWCYNEINGRWYKYNIIEYIGFKKSIFSLYGRTNSTTTWNDNTITIWSLLVTFGCTTSK